MKINIIFILFITIVTPVAALEITSDSFRHNEFIPQEFSCQGENISPPLSWKNIPGGTESFVIICDDPDAPFKTWVHWVIYDIPREINVLEKGILPQEVLNSGAKQGVNDFGNIGYGGPCPPAGKLHRYFFRLFALKKKLNLPAGLTKKDILQAMEGYVIEEAELVGKYRR